MGKGDKKSRRGKIHIGTFGKRRRPSKSNASKNEQAIPVKEKVEKVKIAVQVVETEQAAVPEVVAKPAKAKTKKAEATESAKPATDTKPTKKAPKKAKESTTPEGE